MEIEKRDFGTRNMNIAAEALAKLTDEDLMALQFTMPWQYSTSTSSDTLDADGFATNSGTSTAKTRKEIQSECWDKTVANPFVNTSIRGQAGRLTGFGFGVSSEIMDIQEVLSEIETDPRNRLYHFWTKFVVRAAIEGELFLCLTVHKDGFIEVDFIDPASIDGGTSSSAGQTFVTSEGILFHPSKTVFPLAYLIDIGQGQKEVIPSIHLAYYPDLLEILNQNPDWKSFAKGNAGTPYNKKLLGHKRFIVSWDKTFITRRNHSHLRTVLEWLNYYENLKKYEIDHKKSSGSYVWVVTITDPKAYRLWVSLSAEEKRKTGIMAKKTPGGTLVLPMGMELKAINPQLPRISDSDTDILHMVTGGLNEPEDVTSGQSKGTFASVKASRGPMSDRMSDEIAYFERFLRYDFYRAVFFLRSAVTSFPSMFKRREAVDFKNKKAKFKDIERKPHELIEIAFPVSEVNDAETRAKAYLGVKHGSVYDTLGVSNKTIAEKLGIGNYRRERLQQATEEDRYPELIPTEDAESAQEKKIEPGKKAKSDTDKEDE